MTKSTDTKNIKIIVRALLKKYGVIDSSGEINLQAEVDFTSALLRYMFQREDGESPAESRERVTKEYDKVSAVIALSQAGQAREDMRKRIEAAIQKTPNWDDLKQDWNGFELWLMEKEKNGQTIERFMSWYNSDEFRAGSNLWLNPPKIKEFWGRAFVGNVEIAKPESDGGFR